MNATVRLDSQELSSAWQVPENAIALLVLAHGAGAGFDHANMRAIADALQRVDVATLRFNFPFIEAGSRRADRPDVATRAIRAAVDTAAKTCPQLPVFAGGHSFGGRMTSLAEAETPLGVRGLVFCSFPLHPAGKPGTARAAHLGAIGVPMLFLSGTRDALGEAALLAGVVDELPGAALHWLETADHSYRILKRTRTSEVNVFDEMAAEVRRFVVGAASAAIG